MHVRAGVLEAKPALPVRRLTEIQDGIVRTLGIETLVTRNDYILGNFT